GGRARKAVPKVAERIEAATRGARMFITNPFAGLSPSVPPGVMQGYVLVMILMVAGGTLLDMVHKKSATYFFNNWRTVKARAARRVNGREMMSLAVQSALTDVLASSEFC